MTVMAAEGATAGGASRSALVRDPYSGVRSTSGDTTPQSSPYRRAGSSGGSKAASSGSKGPSGSKGSTGSTGSQGRSGGQGKQGKQGGQQKRQRQQPQRKIKVPSVGNPEFKNYQGIILAEFVVAELLVAATPIASGKGKQTPGLSPYVPRDMTKMLSIGAVFFLLQLMAVMGARWGKFGAMFGGLVLLVVGVNEASNIVSEIDAFAGFTQKVDNVKQTIAGGGGGVRPKA